MNNCVFARSRNAHRLYVWQNGVFLFWMDAQKRWARSDLVQHLYDEAYCKDPDITPEEWFVDSSDFTILDEYEVPADALAALQEVTLCKNVPTADAAATTAAPAAAMSSLSDAGTACSAPAFDYSALDADTADKLRGITECVAELQQSYAWGMAYQVGRAHDLLCGGNRCKTVLQRSTKGQFSKQENTFTDWCNYIGITRQTAYNLLNAYTLICDASPEQQKNLQLAPAKLLYAAGKPTAPTDLVQGVKDGDITTHKQYQELLKENQQLRADRVNAINAARQAESERDAALADVNGLHAANKKLRSECTEAEKQRDGARQVAEAARLRADKWQKEVEAAKAVPVPSTAVDEDELNRRAEALAAELTAPLRKELDALKAHPAAVPDTETDARNAYDSLLLIGRSMKNAWASVKPQLAKLPENTRAGAIDMLNKTLTEIQTEAMKCL